MERKKALVQAEHLAQERHHAQVRFAQKNRGYPQMLPKNAPELFIGREGPFESRGRTSTEADQ